MIIAIGCEFSPVSNWEEVLPEIKAPSNYKDPLKIEAYIQNKREELFNGKAAIEPLTGFIYKAVVADDNETACEGRVVQIEHKSSIATGLVAYVDKMLRNAKEFDVAFPVVGLRLLDTLCIAAMELLGNTKGKKAEQLPVWLVRRPLPGNFIDPIMALTGSADTDPYAVARRLDYPVEQLDTAEGQAKFALYLGHKLCAECW
jgi:hypothetical protein